MLRDRKHLNHQLNKGGVTYFLGWYGYYIGNSKFFLGGMFGVWSTVVTSGEPYHEGDAIAVSRFEILYSLRAFSWPTDLLEIHKAVWTSFSYATLNTLSWDDLTAKSL